jgi:NAD(P)-dependent dehydrogenase (short-subunit alcohol dehydrogenase family)
MARTAVVAGVGPGLGASLARTFAGEGCQVALFARSADDVAELAEDLPDPGEGLASPTDPADVEAVRESFERVREAFGPVDVLVNHASGASLTGLLDTTVEGFAETGAVGGRGAAVCTQEALEDMVETGGRTVLFTGATSSVRSRGGVAERSSAGSQTAERSGDAIGFTATKVAARGMAMDVAQEFGPEGVAGA